jgi:hypothetical protein
MALFGKNSLELFHSGKRLTNYKAKYDRAKYDRVNKIK